MVHRSGAHSADLGVNNTYFYYLMSTANNGLKKQQLRKLDQTDADSIDSGTCSDNSQKTSPVPPPLQKSSGMSTKVLLNGGGGGVVGATNTRHYSDSEESESSLSSIGSNSVGAQQQQNESHKMRFALSYLPLPDSLLKDIRDHSMNTLKLNNNINKKQSPSPSPSPSPPQQQQQPKLMHQLKPIDDPNSQSSRITIKLKELSLTNGVGGGGGDGGGNGRSSNIKHKPSVVNVVKKNGDLYRSDTYYEDKYYNFHINERDVIEEEEEAGPNEDEFDETFAGFRELKSGSSTIRSAKGTVRGVKNRVRNGIATFLQIQQHTAKVSATISLHFQFDCIVAISCKGTKAALVCYSCLL